MLPSSNRLCENREFRLIYARARSYVHPLAVIYVLKQKKPAGILLTGPRIGFVVSKKQGNAVVRNRIKRRMREAVRNQWEDIKSSPYDVIFVGRARMHTAAWSEVMDAINELLTRGGVLAPTSQAKVPSGT